MCVIFDIFEVVGVGLEYEEVKIGKEMYFSGYQFGIVFDVWDILCCNWVFLKGLIIILQGGGYKSFNVMICKMLGFFVNVCFCCVFIFYVDSNFFDMDFVVVWENEEDLYVGIEYQ